MFIKEQKQALAIIIVMVIASIGITCAYPLSLPIALFILWNK